MAILDCDAHYGNGTENIIRRLGIDWIEHHTQGLRFYSANDARDGRYEQWLAQAIEKCLDCDLVLYQAGADPHVDDPLGGILTTAQMIARDRMVFEKLGHLPLVWNLAGGYQVVAGKAGAAADRAGAGATPRDSPTALRDVRVERCERWS